MYLIQILLILFFLFALSRVIFRYKKGDLTTGELFFWFIFWLLAGAVVLWPDSTFIVSRFVGISRGADLVVYISLALLFYLVFKLTVKVERINKNITKIVRQDALGEVRKNDK